MSTTHDEPPAAKYYHYLCLLTFVVFVSCDSTAPGKVKQPVSVTKKSDTAVVTLKPAEKKKTKKKIYLTFDDGPNKGTDNVLNIVKEENVPVTFFLVGAHAFGSKAQKATWDSLQASALVELCNHSFTHAWYNRYDKYYSLPDSVVNDFYKTTEQLQLKNGIGRTPGRNIWRVDSLQFTDNAKTKAAADSLFNAGYDMLGWDLEWHFNPKTMRATKSADDLARQIDSLLLKNKTKQPGNLVLLAHDQVYKNAEDSLQLHQLIRKLKANTEYEFAVASNYPGIKKKAVTDSMLKKTSYKTDSLRRNNLMNKDTLRPVKQTIG
jgi:peptidoglycan/xylan/chitin deacetylase (PgdA/CDA1 family)